MQKRTLFSLILISVLLVTGYLLLISSTPVEKKENPTCCKQTLKECQPENKTNSSGEMIIETLSRQFISVTPVATIR